MAMFDNASSSIPLHHERNNMTVTSGLTNETWESAHTSFQNPSAAAAAAAAASQRSRRFRKGGCSGLVPTLSGINEVGDENGANSGASTSRASLNRNSLHGSIGASVVSSSSSLCYSQQQQQQHHPSYRHANYRNSDLRNINTSSATSSTTRHSLSGINSSFNSFQQPQQVFDNQSYTSHNSSKSATQEINISEYQEEIPNGDETSSLPDDYYDDNSYNTCFRRKNASDTTVSTTTGGNESSIVEMIPTSSPPLPPFSPFSRKRRWYSLVSIFAAFSLAVIGLKLSIDSLSSPHPTSNSKVSSFIPGYQFGGGLGGLTAGQERERKMDLAYNQYGMHLSQPQQQQSAVLQLRQPEFGGRTVPGALNYNIQGPSDPFQGFGAPQFNSEYANAPKQGSMLAGLSSAPLTSYIPPPSNPEDGIVSSSSFTQTTIIIEPMFHGSLMELSVLPFNPRTERAVVWDVPLSGGGSLQAIFGSCLHLVQCNHYDGIQKIAASTDSKRSLLEVVPRDDVEAAIAQSNSFDKVESLEPEKPFRPPTEEDPPLKTEFQRFSTYVNVDCSTPEGVDRGIAHDLAESDLVDVFYSANPYDLARLFSPPRQVYGRGVVMLRNPIQRAVATYKRLQIKNPDMIGDMTLEQFAKSDLIPDNFLTRTLSKNMNAPLTEDDVSLAKEVLKRKFVVGMYDRYEESVLNFEAFFGWKLNDSIKLCQSKVIQREMDSGYNKFDTLPYDNVYAAIAEKNREDIGLFKFAEYLYDYQRRALFGNS